MQSILQIQRYRADWRSTEMQSVLQIQRYRADWRSTKMQSILQIPEIKSRWEINQDAEHPTDPGDIEQTGDQPKCRASYKSRIYKVDGRSTKMQSILQITETQSRLGINQDAEHPTDQGYIQSRLEINQDAEHLTDHGDIEQMGDQPRCRASYRSRRYRVDGRSTKMQSILEITEIQSRLGINRDAGQTTDDGG